jgi:cyclophilin family peptidyl-prolyl cis-trans isomerase
MDKSHTRPNHFAPQVKKMVVTKRAMQQSPTQDIHGDESSAFNIHETDPEKGPLHVKMDSDECSTSFWNQGNDGSKSSDDMTLPVWSANPQSPTDDNLSPLQTKTSLKFTAKRRKIGIPAFVVGIVVVGLAAIFTSRISTHSAEEQVAILSSNREHMDGIMKKAEHDILMLKREISAMDSMIQTQQNLEASSGSPTRNNNALIELRQLQESLKFLSEDAETLKEEVQSVSRKEVTLKYGSGPHYVEMELVFPDKEDGPTKFVIELAPLDEMPHSVHTFLEMVSTGLLDGCSFILNALHVVKAAPLPYDGSPAAEKARAFSAHGLESVAFKEYSEAYPHKQYTVGFAADGSPSFFINTEDNSDIHVGDPCFGKIIEGFDAVRRLEAAPTRNGIWYQQRIGIKHARILKAID